MAPTGRAKAKRPSRASKPQAKPESTSPAPARFSTFEQLFSKSPKQVQSIAQALRRVIREVLPNAVERVYAGWRIAFYSEPFEICGIGPSKSYCSLYFPRGADLPDPEKLLEGSGKKTRHVKVHSLDRVNIAALKELMVAARSLALANPGLAVESPLKSVNKAST